MDFWDYYYAPYRSRFLHRVYRFPMPMIFPRAGMMSMRGNSEEDELSPPNEGRPPKWMRKMQRAGIMGPVVPFGNDPYSVVALPPWMAPNWRPRGGYYNDPRRWYDRALKEEILPLERFKKLGNELK